MLVGRLFRVARILSLDVVLGTLGSATYMLWVFGARVDPLLLLLLALATWLVYTLDHLLDAKRVAAPAINPRHRYFQLHFQVLLRVWVAIGILALALAIGLGARNTNLFVLGGWACVLVVLHMALVLLAQSRKGPLLQKEFAVAFIYTYGISIPALLGASQPLSWEIGVALGQFIFFAWMNLLIYARFEEDLDAQDGQTSSVRWLGKHTTDVVVSGFVLFNLAASGVLLVWGRSFSLPWSATTLGIMSFLEGIVILAPLYFARAERYRIWAESVFMLPLLFWLPWL